ncbi:hypothetical protein ABEB36_010066 [Hypothenemus hampei]|uniref:HIT-type domain-containing protein n=1 Tax=Hypothenemus hampei TaxID=57062 RepID=A0ABD1ELD3_HYPHA
MSKVCIICTANGIYKCPICYVYYCSSKCCKKHRADGCELLQQKEPPQEPPQMPEALKSSDEIPSDRLQLLKNSDAVKSLLSNPHLRDLLVTIDNAEDFEQIIQKAMLEPIFVEFADACIKAVEPQENAQDHT